MTIEQHGKVRSEHIHRTAVAEEIEERGWLPDFFPEHKHVQTISLQPLPLPVPHLCGLFVPRFLC